MTRINEVLTAVTARLAEWFPDLKGCEVHDGKFDVEELKRWAVKAPAMRVALLGVPKSEDTGTEQTDVHLQLAIFIITRDAPQASRGAAARNLVEALLSRIPRARWRLLPGIASPDVDTIEARNFYNGKIDKLGAALWAVTWRQRVRLGDDVFGGDGILPTKLYAGFGDGHVGLTEAAINE